MVTERGRIRVAEVGWRALTFISMAAAMMDLIVNFASAGVQSSGAEFLPAGLLAIIGVGASVRAGQLRRKITKPTPTFILQSRTSRPGNAA